MKCTICKQGETSQGNTTVTLERGNSTLVFKNVPAKVCLNCGEKYVSSQVSAHLMKTAEEAVRQGVEVDIREHKAA
jgi:YgiT-type zinc finger domain-containing protein